MLIMVLSFKLYKASTRIELSAKPFSDSVLSYIKDSVNYVDVGNNAAELFKCGCNTPQMTVYYMSIRVLNFKLYNESTRTKLNVKPSSYTVL